MFCRLGYSANPERRLSNLVYHGGNLGPASNLVVFLGVFAASSAVGGFARGGKKVGNSRNFPNMALLSRRGGGILGDLRGWQELKA